MKIDPREGSAHVEQTIVCPGCGERIPISKALTQQVEADLRARFDADAKEQQRERQLRFDQELAAAKQQLETEVTKKAHEATAAELRTLRRQLGQAQQQQARFEQRLADAAAREKKQAQKAVDEATKRADADHRRREQQLEKQLNDAKRQAADLKRRLEQAPQTIQGDVAQLGLGDMLRREFPADTIEQVRRGVRGGDVLQKVYSPTGEYCGAILWESKNTRDWCNGWLEKLRADQRREKAEIAVLASAELPRTVPHFGQIDGVWVTGFALAPCLAAALRTNLIQLAGLRQASQANRDEQMQLLYDYLASTVFRQRIEAIVESFRIMQDDLNGERTMMERYWSKRETHLQVVVRNLSGMYGDMQAIVSLPNIRRLELSPAVAS
jgi:hypothetical protein